MLKSALALTLAAATVLPATAIDAQARDGRRYYTTDNGIRYWRGEDGRYYCKRGNGTTGLLIGGAAGALIGREIDRNRKRARCR